MIEYFIFYTNHNSIGIRSAQYVMPSNCKISFYIRFDKIKAECLCELVHNGPRLSHVYSVWVIVICEMESQFESWLITLGVRWCFPPHWYSPSLVPHLLNPFKGNTKKRLKWPTSSYWVETNPRSRSTSKGKRISILYPSCNFYWYTDVPRADHLIFMGNMQT